MKENRDSKKRKKLLIIEIAIISIAVIAFLVMLFGFGINEKVVKMKYTEFNQYLEDGQIKEATINSSAGYVRFKIKGSETITYETSYPYSATFPETLLLHGADVKYAGGFQLPSFSTIIMTVFCGMLIYIFYKTSKTNSQGNEVVVDDSRKTTFESVAGMQDIKDDMMSLVRLIKSEKYKEEHIKIPKGILFQGPPGNGKTLLARAFAGECGMNFIAVNASDFGSPLVGVSSMKISSLFDKARKKEPCVIFIDEIDSVGARRTTASNSTDKEMNTILTSLLNQMDGFNQNEGVIVIGATNRAQDIDEALLRPGRFDRKFTIPNPDIETRKELFKLYTKKLVLSDDITPEDFASITSGLSSSTIENIINEAHISASVDGRKEIQKSDFHNALIRLSVDGVLSKKSRWKEDTLRSCAFHEAGHAIVASMLGFRVREITVIPTTSTTGGLTMIDDEQDGFGSVESAENRICSLYGGKVAEEIINKSINKISFGASNDIEVATKLAVKCVVAKDGIDYFLLGRNGEEKMSAQTTELLNCQYERCKKLLSSNQPLLEGVAEKLIEQDTLSEKEFNQIMSEYLGGI